MDQAKQKKIELLLLVVIALIAVGAYFYGYNYFVDKANAVNNEAKQIQARINILNEKTALKPVYEEAIADSEEATKLITAKYGPGNTPEKDIMLAKSIEKLTGAYISAVSFSDDELTFVSEDVDENGEAKITGYKGVMIINYEAGYEELKSIMDFITEHPERMNVEAFTASLNQETGKLTGSMNLNLYAIKAAEKAYEAPVIDGFKTGTDNIFGSYK